MKAVTVPRKFPASGDIRFKSLDRSGERFPVHVALSWPEMSVLPSRHVVQLEADDVPGVFCEDCVRLALLGGERMAHVES